MLRCIKTYCIHKDRCILVTLLLSNTRDRKKFRFRLRQIVSHLMQRDIRKDHERSNSLLFSLFFTQSTKLLKQSFIIGQSGGFLLGKLCFFRYISKTDVTVSAFVIFFPKVSEY